MRFFLKILLSVCLLCALSACGRGGVQPQPGPAESASSSSSASPEEWSKASVSALFDREAEPGWTLIDCVPVSDFAFERVGVVLFQDHNYPGHTQVAFLDQDGFMQRCGMGASVQEPTELTYCGGGAVTFHVLSGDGAIYTLKITLTIDGSDVNFCAETIEDSIS